MIVSPSSHRSIYMIYLSNVCTNLSIYIIQHISYLIIIEKRFYTRGTLKGITTGLYIPYLSNVCTNLSIYIQHISYLFKIEKRFYTRGTLKDITTGLYILNLLYT